MKSRDASRDASDQRIDTGDFARRGGLIAGTRAACDFARLREVLASDRGEIRWQLDGERRARHEGGHDDYLLLSIAGEVDLQCTRCLQPLAVPIGEKRLFRLFATEAQALREDAEVDDYDALVGGSRFDPLELVEDEVMLALPIAPRHERCHLLDAPDPSAAGGTREPDDADASRENPFAALERLRRHPRQE